MTQLETPILFTVFNRPDLTARVFAEIRKQKPLRLFIAADGPRNEDEKTKTEETRAIVSNIDWPCEVKTKFEQQNLGCKMAMSGAISWFFENVEEGIILEDDCLPHPDFFRFCTELLARYRDNEKIMMIGGNNFRNELTPTAPSYYFSKYPHIWGWATWRRAWKKYDIEMKDYNLNKHIVPAAYKVIISSMLRSKIDTWDYQWAYAIFNNHGITIVPRLNLVSNIGFGKAATHTKKQVSKKSEVPLHSFSLLRHPTGLEIDQAEDHVYETDILNYPGSTNIFSRMFKAVLETLKR